MIESGINTWFDEKCTISFYFSVSYLVMSFVTPWAVGRQAPLSMEFFRQEY